MKILVKDSTGKALANAKIQLQIKGKDSGFLSLSTDAQGKLTLDDKYKGQQIASTTSGTAGQWASATDGATLTVAQTTGAGATTGSGTAKSTTTK